MPSVAFRWRCGPARRAFPTELPPWRSTSPTDRHGGHSLLILPPRIYNLCVWPLFPILHELFPDRVIENIVHNFLKRPIQIEHPIVTAFLPKWALESQLPCLLSGEAFEPPEVIQHSLWLYAAGARI